MISIKTVSRGAGGLFTVRQSCGDLYCLLPGGYGGVYSLALYSINGMMLGKVNAHCDGTGRIAYILQRMGTSGLSTGCYLMRVTGASGRFEGDFYFYR